MAYIYKITNDINDKVYVGKTERTIQERFKEHCRDACRPRCEKRPLYSAMQKYGVEHFAIHLLEETDNPVEREQYWIEELGTYNYGYNATRGGDGSIYLNHDEIVSVYQQLQNCMATARKLHVCVDTVRDVLKQRNILIRDSGDISRENNKKIVQMIDSLTGKVVQVFPTYAAASRYVIEKKLSNSKHLDGISTHIRDAAIGRRKMAYGFVWKLLN